MCGRYILASKIKTIENRFNVNVVDNEAIKPNYNLGIGQKAAVITDDNPKEIQFFTFGLTPFWAKKQMYLFNARTEGDHNKENNPKYSGQKGIIVKPAYRKAIRSQRCLIIADAYIEGTTKEGLNKPYLIYVRDLKPFSFAGIWDSWYNPESNEQINSFSIITTTANELLQKLPHERMPVILEPSHEKKWLNPNTPLSDITRLLKAFPAEKMNAYPISNDIKNKKTNSRYLIEPQGDRLLKEESFETRNTLRKAGMGRYK
ncbi:MAG: SOS response-associated peptidase [Bacteroidales bacterium]|nr:SOS response-associated peptidase [Bacteroidales bacterium]MBN2755968.1 SOS response-associated peptidase [Bacteroidales bacterium]